MTEPNTRQKVRRLLELDPTLTGTEIGRLLGGISKQAVSKHIQKIDVLRAEHTKYRSCVGCRKQISFRSKTGLCADCLKQSYEYLFTCAQCGKRNTVTGSLAKYRRINRARATAHRYEFCNARCASRYARIREMKLKSLETGNVK